MADDRRDPAHTTKSTAILEPDAVVEPQIPHGATASVSQVIEAYPHAPIGQTALTQETESTASRTTAPNHHQPAPATPAAQTTTQTQVTESTTTAPAGARPRFRRIRRQVPAALLSVSLHIAALMILAAATFSEIRKLDRVDITAGPVLPEQDLTMEILEQPTEVPEDEIIYINNSLASETPLLSRPSPDAVGPGALVSNVDIQVDLSSIVDIPQDAAMVIQDEAGVAFGDPNRHIDTIEDALNALASEILRRLELGKLTVVWLFDESASMRDDQREIRNQFDACLADLDLKRFGEDARTAPLTHVVAGYGPNFHYTQGRPTATLRDVYQGIERLRIDTSGVELSFEAIERVLADQRREAEKRNRQLMVVLVTDESGDDEERLEATIALVRNLRAPIYVLGRQALFGYDRLRIRYVDKITGDVYWPTIKRGPESPATENLPFDGLKKRYDELPSGFPCYDLARLVQQSGGVYFTLPGRETELQRQRERFYNAAVLREYQPDYNDRERYWAEVQNSPLRTRLLQIIEQFEEFGTDTIFPIDPNQIRVKAARVAEEAMANAQILARFEQELRQLDLERRRETSPRWQAHYDLMLAQLVTFQVKQVEYAYFLKQQVQNPPRPKQPIPPGLMVRWDTGHAKAKFQGIPNNPVAKKYGQARRLLQNVHDDYLNTPWALLAKMTLDRGLGVRCY